MAAVAKYPDSTKTSLEQRLRAGAPERWPQIAGLQIRHRGDFSYVDATLTDDTTLKLCRLRYVGSAHDWQFATYRASHDDYDESVFFTGLPVGSCQDALDTACGLYLNDPTAWTRPPTNLRLRPLSDADLEDRTVRMYVEEQLCSTCKAGSDICIQRAHWSSSCRSTQQCAWSSATPSLARRRQNSSLR